MTGVSAIEDGLMEGSGEGEDVQREDAPCCGGEGFVRNDVDKGARSRFSLICAFKCAWDGIAYATRTQRNMKIHLCVAAVAIALGVVLAIDALSWAAIALCIVLVLAVECLNTALESVVDLVSPGYAELAKRAKDCAAGAVLLCAFGAVVVAAVVFVPRVWALLAG